MTNSNFKKKIVITASPEKSSVVKFKKIQAKSSFQSKRSISGTPVYIAGSRFNTVFVRTVHPNDSTKDGFIHTAKEELKNNRIVADRVKCVNVSFYVLVSSHFCFGILPILFLDSC